MKRNRIRMAVAVVAGFFFIGVVAQEQARKDKLRQDAVRREVGVSRPMFRLPDSPDVKKQAELDKQESERDLAQIMNQFAAIINQAGEAEKQRKIAKEQAERAREKQVNDVVANLVISAIFGGLDDGTSDESDYSFEDQMDAAREDRETMARRDAAIAAQQAPYIP